MNHPGEVTKLWRKEQKLSIPALAKRSGIDKGTISRFERGGDYRKRVFDAIISALGKTQQELYAMVAQLPASIAGVTRKVW
jgi:transcriptional regulator with XRE-family HTH domain